MKKFAPFLKLYADYVKNFDRAMELINTWTEKSQEFASLLQALQVRSRLDLPRFELIIYSTVLHSTYSRRVITYMGKPSAVGPAQPFILSGSIDE